MIQKRLTYVTPIQARRLAVRSALDRGLPQTTALQEGIRAQQSGLSYTPQIRFDQPGLEPRAVSESPSVSFGRQLSTALNTQPRTPFNISPQVPQATQLAMANSDYASPLGESFENVLSAPQSQQRRLPSGFSSTPSAFQMQLQEIIKNRMGSRGIDLTTGIGNVANSIENLQGSLAATPGWAGLDLSQARRLEGTENSGLMNTYQGLRAADSARRRDLAEFSKGATSAFNTQYEAEGRAGIAASDRSFELDKLALDIPAGQQVMLGGKMVTGSKQADPSATRYQSQFNPITGQRVIFDPATGFDVGGGSYNSSSQGGDGFTGGDGMRTDRNNNPLAIKMYPQTIALLTSAGLVSGKDFTPQGDSTAGVDTDGVATVTFTTPEAGIVGGIAVLSGGQMGSWYANTQKYGGASMVLESLSQLSGQRVSSQNAQQVFNNLPDSSKRQVVQTIYSHEGGNGQMGNEQQRFASMGDQEQFDFALKYAGDHLGLTDYKAASSYAALAQDTNTLPTPEPTVEQKQFAIYGARMDQAEDIFDAVADEIQALDPAEFLVYRASPELGGIRNAFITNALRQQEQAERNFINAILRRESGAVISQQEFKSARAQYFPVPYDDAITLQNKKANRELVINGFKWASGAGAGKNFLDFIARKTFPGTQYGTETSTQFPAFEGLLISSGSTQSSVDYNQFNR